MNLENCALLFLYDQSNANAVSALLASLDTDPVLSELKVILHPLKRDRAHAVEQLRGQTKVVIAVSLFSVQFSLYEEIVPEYRSALGGKETIVIAGGPHPSGDPFSTLISFADVVCIGEGELTIRDFLTAFFSGTPLEEVRGVALLRNGRLLRTPKQPLINLDDFPPFSVKHHMIRPIEITRGCAWKCRFCQIRNKGTPVRHRSPEVIAHYAAITKEHFRRRRTDIRFISPNALSYGSKDGRTLDLAKVRQMLTMVRDVLEEGDQIFFGSFPSEVRPETISKESVQILKEFSDSKTIILGGQSGSQRILELSDRGHTPEETLRATELLIDAGFEVFVDIIFGLPGEEEEDVKLTVEHMKDLVDLGARIHSHTFLPLVGTPFASKPPGEIHPIYHTVLPTLQGSGKLKGQHMTQERQAKEMSRRRSLSKEIRRNLEESTRQQE